MFDVAGPDRDPFQPTAPTNLSASYGAGNHPHLTWTASSAPQGVSIGYHVERKSTVAPQWLQLNTSPIYGTTYDDPIEYGGVPTWYRVRPVSGDGFKYSSYSNTATIFTHGQRIDVAQKLAEPKASVKEGGQFGMRRSYPNPFNPVTTLEYEIVEAGRVSLRVFDAMGREVAALVGGYHEPGVHHVTFDGRALSSGVYIFKLVSGGRTSLTKALLLR